MKNFQNKTKIIKVSRHLRALARLGLIACALGLLLFIFTTITLAFNGGNARAVYISIGGIVEMILAMVICLNFFRFFNRLKNGELFDAKTVAHLAAAGQWWLGYWCMDFMFGVFGNQWMGTKMDFGFGQLFASLVVIFVAWLLKEAQTLQEEQQLTV